ncbi:MAG: biotin transporter BioY [Candidatus Bathyarchaeia archaeon]
MRLTALDITLTSLFAALTAIGAYIFIPLPFSPVPITMQTLFVYLSGACLGSRRGALSQLTYILLGAVGLPIFSGGKAGVGVIFGPTGGYLAGFVVGAYIIGKLVEARDRSSGLSISIASMLVGSAFVYLLGVLQLSWWLKLEVGVATMIGVLPFLPGDIVKIILASLISLKIRRIFPSLLPIQAHRV